MASGNGFGKDEQSMYSIPSLHSFQSASKEIRDSAQTIEKRRHLTSGARLVSATFFSE